MVCVLQWRLGGRLCFLLRGGAGKGTNLVDNPGLWEEAEKLGAGTGEEGGSEARQEGEWRLSSKGVGRAAERCQGLRRVRTGTGSCRENWVRAGRAGAEGAARGKGRRGQPSNSRRASRALPTSWTGSPERLLGPPVPSLVSAPRPSYPS